jgi:putative oxidoreductase
MMDAVDLGLLVLRVVVGVGFSLHGMQKLFGWFDGGGPDATARWFASLGFGGGRPAALLSGTAETCGGLGLAMGLLTPLSAFAMIAPMTTAAFVNNAAGGFWSAKKGWELNLYLIAVAGAVAIAGPGRYSLDAILGLELTGPLTGALVIAVGFAAGWLRWVTRDRSAGS